MSLKRILTSSCLVLLWHSFLFAQNDISINGTISDTKGSKLANVTVTLLDEQHKILFYKFSDNNGHFVFNFTDSTTLRQVISIQAAFFGYEKSNLIYLPNKSTYDFILEEGIQLDEVKITSRVSQKGDTTVYNVDAFKAEEDRSIGDVISRLPGMAVDEDGKITYYKKSIAGLYIHGDDLMQGEYGLASKAIRPELIKSIELIERFQPKKVLKNKIITNDIAINLVLVDENSLKVSGNAQLGLGLPNLIEASVAPMIFNKKTKTLNVAKLNNSGESYPIRNLRDILSDGVQSNPSVPNRYFNRNKSGLVSGNFLTNLADSLQMRLQAQYVSDNRVMNYSSVDISFLDRGDSVIFKENQLSQTLPRFFTTSLTFEKNKSTNHFKNASRLELGQEKNLSDLVFNINTFSQKLDVKHFLVGNSFNWTPISRRQNNLDFALNTSYQKKPQYLNVFSGIDSTVLNNNESYRAFYQAVEKNVFKNHISVKYFINDKKIIKKSLMAGVSNEFQTLTSGIDLEQLNGTLNPYQGDPGNSLSWQLHKEYISANFLIERNKLKVNLQLPLTYQQIKYRQAAFNLDENSNNIFFNPNLLLTYYINHSNHIDFNYFFTNTFGSINNVYRGLIYSNFKNSNRNLGGIHKSNLHNLGVSYRFRDAISLFDFSTKANYSFNRSNMTYSRHYEDDIISTVLLPYANTYNVSQYSVSMGKYLDFIQSKLEISSNYNITHNNQVINEVFLPFVNKNFGLNLLGGSSIQHYLSFKYAGSANWYWSSNSGVASTGAVDSRFSVYNHKFSVIIIPTSNLNVFIDGRQQLNQTGNTKTSYFFTDLKARYNLNKIRTEFEAELTNLFNVKSYGTYSLIANQFHSTNYQLRGRMILIKANFMF